MSDLITSDGSDIVVVGASAGGVETLRRFLSHLEGEYRGSVFIVLHVSSQGPSLLPEILARVTALSVAHAVNGEPVEPGRVYVAPPDFHLLLRGGRVELSRGPRENGHRPAIDALFRSAVSSYGRRVVGVVLSGTLDDGSDGLRTITDGGGKGIVQDPDQAVYRTMPDSAIAYGGAVEVMPVERIGPRLVELAQKGHGRQERVRSIGNTNRQSSADTNGGPFLTCPDCGGVLTEIEQGGIVRFSCRTGHQYSEQSLVALHRDGLEYALSMALRALRERADLSSRIAERFRMRGHAGSARRFERDAEQSLSALATLRRTMGSMGPPPAHEDEAEDAPHA